LGKLSADELLADELSVDKLPLCHNKTTSFEQNRTNIFEQNQHIPEKSQAKGVHTTITVSAHADACEEIKINSFHRKC
jgi:hypothetical protein